jgi:hypothetical protein
VPGQVLFIGLLGHHRLPGGTEVVDEADERPLLLLCVSALSFSWIEAPYDGAMYAQFPLAIPRMPSWWPLKRTATRGRSVALSLAAVVVIGNLLYGLVFAPHLITKLAGWVNVGPSTATP